MIFVHLGALFVIFVTILIADKHAWSWMRGKKETLSLKRLNALHTIVWVGLISMIVSGAIMAWPLKDYLVTNVAFYTKMFFVLALVVNSFFIGKFMKVAAEKPFATLHPKEKTPILISGVVSTLSWVGAFVSALYMSTSQWIFYLLSRIF